MGGSTDRILRYIIAGDNKSALKAMEETEKASDKTGSSIEKTGKKADDSSKHIGTLSKAFGGMKNVIGFGAGALGLGAVAFGLKDVVKGGEEWQSQQAQLRNAMKNTGEMGKIHMDRVNSAVEHSSTHGGFAPAEETQGMTQLIQLTGSASAAIHANAAAVNLARGAHLEYSQALKIVAKAQTGTAGKSQQYLGIIQPVKTYVEQLTAVQKKQNPELLRHAELLDKQATAMEINRVVMKKYKNATAEYSKTASGAMSNFKNMIELLTEKAGRVFLPLLAKVAQFFAKVAQGVIKEWPRISHVARAVFAAIGSAIKPVIGFLEHSRGAIAAVIAGIAALGAAFAIQSVIEGVSSAVAGLTVAFQTLTGAEVAADAADPFTYIALGIAAVAAGVVYAYMHFKTFREVVNTVFGAVKSIVLTAVGFIKQHWELLLATFSLPIFVLVEVIKHFSQLKKGVEGVFNGIAGFVGSVFDGIVNGVVKGVNLIIKAINVVIGAYNKVPSAFKPTKNINPIKELGEVGKHPAARGGHHSSAGSHPPEIVVHAHLHMGGREVTKVIVRDKRATKELAESLALYTSQLQARA